MKIESQPGFQDLAAHALCSCPHLDIIDDPGKLCSPALRRLCWCLPLPSCCWQPGFCAANALGIKVYDIISVQGLSPVLRGVQISHQGKRLNVLAQAHAILLAVVLLAKQVV